VACNTNILANKDSGIVITEIKVVRHSIKNKNKMRTTKKIPSNKTRCKLLIEVSIKFPCRNKLGSNLTSVGRFFEISLIVLSISLVNFSVFALGCFRIVIVKASLPLIEAFPNFGAAPISTVAKSPIRIATSCSIFTKASSISFIERIRPFPEMRYCLPCCSR